MTRDLFDNFGYQEKYIKYPRVIPFKLLLSAKFDAYEDLWIIGRIRLDERYEYETEIGNLKFVFNKGWIIENFKGYKHLKPSKNDLTLYKFFIETFPNGDYYVKNPLLSIITCYIKDILHLY